MSVTGGTSPNGGFSLEHGVSTAACPDPPLSFAGSQGTDCMRTIWHPSTWDRRGDITYGNSVQEPKLTSDCNSAAGQAVLYDGSLASTGCGNIPIAVTGYPTNGVVSSVILRGSNGSTNKGWLTAYDPISHPTFGDGETCIDGQSSEIDNEKSYGVAALITEGANQISGSCGASDGGAYVFMASNAKKSSYNRLGIMNLCTGTITYLASTTLVCGTPGVACLDQYGGGLPPANTDHNRGQPDWHEYAQFAQVCLRIAQVGNTVTLTGRSWRIGGNSGWIKGRVENNDPGPPGGITAWPRYLMGTTIYTGIRAANIGSTGMIGVAGGAVSAVQESSITNFRWSP